MQAQEERPPLQAENQYPNALGRALWVTGGVLTYATFDYLVVGLFRPNNLTAYKVLQYCVQAGITYLLYKKCGLSSAIGFNIIWWTFGADMVYYGIAELRGETSSKRWPGAGSWKVDNENGEYSGAGWTPIGLIRGARAVETRGIPTNTLVAQSIAGAVIGIGITITF